MPSGSEEYAGYTIHWDTISLPDAKAWNAKAGLISPADSSGFCKIIAITGSLFTSESEARDYVVRAAKRQIDEMVSIQKTTVDQRY